ncbi:MAG: phosphatidylserine decarboxylase [Blastocatellia bacterium]|nr:phosphatidylserine decarboxylase [Blastocatellia bacterium]
MNSILLYNRRTRSIEEETLYERRVMEFLYGSSMGFALTELLFRHRWATEFVARRMHRPGSRAKIAAFIREHGIDPAELERPVESFQTFNEFFIRKLKPEARPVDRAPESLISVADCRLAAWPIERGAVVPVKARRFTIAALLDDEAMAARYLGGWCLIFRLAPVDYHRFCFVDDGEQGPVRVINGFYRSVHPLSLRRMKAVFTENQREACVLQTRNFGEVVHVDVGATGVGRIVQRLPHGGAARRGEEKGYFEFGGSTVILLLGAGVAEIDEDIATHSARGIETIVRYGEKIGRRA